MKQSTPAAPVEVASPDYGSVCQRFRAALHPLFVHGVSLYDETGELLWLTASFGTKEDEAVHKAYERFADGSGTAVVGYDLGSARSAILFRIPNTGRMVGVAVVVLDTGVLAQYRRDLRKLVTKKLLHAMRHFAHSRGSSNTRQSSSSTHTAPPFLKSLVSAALNSAAAADLPRLTKAKAELPRVQEASRPSLPITTDSPTKALGDFSQRRADEIAGDKRPQKGGVQAIEAKRRESAIEKDSNTSRTSRRLTTRRQSPDAKSTNSKSASGISLDSLHPSRRRPPKPPERLPALALAVQRLVSLNDDVQPVRCEVLWALPGRVGRNGKDDVKARQIMMPPMMDRRALIEFCRWFRRQSQAWRDAMPVMWLKFSIGAMLDKTFIHFVERCLKASELPVDRLGFELPAHDAVARADDLLMVATSLEYLRCFIVLDNFNVQADQLELLRLPAVRMIKLAPEIATAMRIDTSMRKRVAGVARATRAFGINMVVKRSPSLPEALWYREYGVEFVQSQALSPGEPLDALVDVVR